MHKKYLEFAAIFGGLAVAFGAFGAHGLESITSDQKILHGFQTGVQYQMMHALVLLAIGIMYQHFPGSWMKWAANCFIAGIFLFSGSLYLITFLKIQSSSAVRIVGPVTPIGGLFFITGWLILLIAIIKKK
jgi:uncharacterized membrane protein YgdD (TMEM256/DUF423 family)